MMENHEWKKYLYTFFITAVIFATAMLLSNFYSEKKMNELKNIESRIAVDILASETQFSLLSELPCKDISANFLSKELATLGDKLSYAEQNRGFDDGEVLNLKKYYSLLQIKDYLLMQKIEDRCKNETLSIIYFYSNIKNKCDDCGKKGMVLTRLRQEYPDLRIYSFDYDLDLSALETLISIYGVKNEQPALIIKDKVYYDFKSIEDIKNLMPELKETDKIRATEKETKQEVLE